MLPTQELPSTACPACSPSPLLGCLHNSSSAAPLGSFLPKSLAGIFGFFSFFPSLRPVSAHPVPMFLENRLHPSPQELFLSMRQWLCLSLFLTQGILHLPYSPSPGLLSPFCFVSHVLGSLCPSVGVLLLPPPLSTTLSPGQLGVVAVPSPALACSINPCPCYLSAVCCSQSNGNMHPPGWVARSLGGGGSAFLWGLLPVHGGSEHLVSPHASLSSPCPLPASVSHCRECQEHPG